MPPPHDGVVHPVRVNRVRRRRGICYSVKENLGDQPVAIRRPIVSLIYLLYCVEAGIFLLLAPWSTLWIRNAFAQAPALHRLLMSGQVRGAVSALGLLMIVTALVDFAGFCRAVRES